MLIKATIEDIKKYEEFAYSLAMNPAKSCYPTYVDGIKTKEDFLKAAEDAVSSDNTELLLFSVDGIVEGWISYFWIPEDNYLQLSGCNINCGTEQALTEFVNVIETSFHGYKAYFGYPGDNGEAIYFLKEHGFKCIEQDWNHSFFFEGYTQKESSGVVEKITRRNFDKFRAIYHAAPDAYWNADRIFETIEKWTIFVYNQAEHPIAGIFLSGNKGYFEIFGVEFAEGVLQEHVFRELLIASLNACKASGAEYLTYFCKDDEKHILKELGFKCVGEYVLYIKEI